MRSKMMRVILAGVLALVAMGAVFTASAGASPQWKFNGTTLTGSEKIVGAAISSSLTIPGMTTTCEHFLYTMAIENAAGTGKGSITELPLYECHTNTSACTVEAITPKKLPWPTHLTTVSSKNYLFVEGIEVGILYGGKLCALGEVEVLVKGTAGGLISNETETATFNASTFTATGAVLKVGGTKIEWNGVFPTEGFEWHREQAISVG